ncbi:MFS transporter [Thermoplasma sp.]|uniref:MFS transporter n=1 Tax=Thermoplasma sp. TaxID=1973142 RepID=UPI002635E9E9|nr:MFS transporter [Thermoplasma sp.]
MQSTRISKYSTLLYNSSKILALSSTYPVEIYTMFLLSLSNPGKIQFGTIMILSLIFSMFIDPFLGKIIDSFPRRRLIEMLQTISILFEMFSLLLWHFHMMQRVLVLSVLLIYINVSSSVYFDMMRALLQTISHQTAYLRMNGIAEASGQFPSLLGSAIAVPALLLIGPQGSLALAIIIQIISLLFISLIEENFKPVRSLRDKKIKHNGVLSMIRRYPKQTFLIYFLNFPFIMIIVGNLLKPIFIVNVIHGNVSDISFSEMDYAAFAALTGLAISMFPRGNELANSFIFFAIYIAALLLMPFSSNFIFFMIFQSLHGIGNPGTRINRNSFVMKHVPMEMLGRFSSGVSLLSTITTMAILIAVTLEINSISIIVIFLALGTLSIAAMIMAFLLKQKTAMTMFSTDV